MTAPKPEAMAEYLADQIASAHYGPTVRGPAGELFIEGEVDLVEVAKALMQRFVIVERRKENTRFVHTLVDHAFKAAKTSVENDRGDAVYSADHLKHAISLLASAVEVLEHPEEDR